MRDVVKKKVDDIVEALNAGKKPEDFAQAAHEDPYVFIMEADGKLLVHPTLQGESLKEKAGPVYEEVAKGTAEGTFVRYQWAGANKCTYARRTQGGLIVGCGFNE